MYALTAHDVRRIAVESLVHPRTIRKFLDGKPVRDLTSQRIRQAMERIGIVAPTAEDDPDDLSPDGRRHGGGRT